MVIFFYNFFVKLSLDNMGNISTWPIAVGPKYSIIKGLHCIWYVGFFRPPDKNA